MQIKKLHIDGFGVFYEKQINNFQSGVNLLYGSNEKGKSTLLDFFRYTLFSYPDPRTKANKRLPLNGGAHGGRLWLENTKNQALSIYRSGNRKDFELDFQGKKSENLSLYQSLMGNANSDLYQNIFAITIDELRGIDDLNASGMEDRIFSMGMGLSGADFGAFSKNLMQQSEKYFKERGSTQILIEKVNQIQEKEKAINHLKGNLEEFNRIADERKENEQQLADLKKVISQHNATFNQLNNLKKVYPDYINYNSSALKLKEFGEMTVYPENIKTALETLCIEQKGLDEQLLKLKNEITHVKKEIDNIVLVDQLSSHHELLDYFKTNLKTYENAIQNKTHEEQKKLSANTALQRLLEELGKEFELALLLKLENGFELKSKGVATEEELQKLDRKVESKINEKANLNKEIERLTKQKEEASEKLQKATIKNEKESAAMKAKLTHLDTAFRIAIVPQNNSSKSKNYLSPILFLLLLLAGIVLFTQNLSFGVIIVVLAISGLAYSFIQLKRNSTIGGRNTDNPQDINQQIETIKEKLQQFDECYNEIRTLQQTVSDKEQQVLQLDKEIKDLEDEIKTLTENWEKELSKLQLPPSILPKQINNFLNNVSTIKRLHDEQTQASKKIQEQEKQINEFQSKVRLLNDNKTIDSTMIHQLISQLEENEEKRNEQELLQKNLAQLKQKSEEKQVIFDAKEASISSLYKKVGVKTKEAFDQHFERQKLFQTTQSENEEAQKNIKLIFGEDNLETTLQILAKTEPSNLSISIDKTEEELKDAQLAYDALKEELGRKEERLQSLVNVSEMYAAQNEKNSLEEHLKDDTTAWVSNRLAQKILEKSKEKYEKERQPTVIQHTKNYFQKITQNNYNDIRISLGNQHVSITDASGKEKKVEELSRGTKEQLLLSLRLGLIEEYETNAEPLPVIFDDIMVNFDNQRAKITAEIIQAFAQNRQVLFFTCHEHIKELFKNLGANILNW